MTDLPIPVPTPGEDDAVARVLTNIALRQPDGSDLEDILRGMYRAGYRAGREDPE